MCALHLSAHSHIYNNLKAANTSSGVLSTQEAIVSQTATQTIAGADETGPSEDNHSSVFFVFLSVAVPPVCAIDQHHRGVMGVS